MIAVGIGRAYHDCSISAYIDGKFKYAKYERDSSVKHLKAPEPWFWKKLIQWGVDLDKIDIIIETDGGGFSFQSSVRLPKLPYGNINLIRKHKTTHKTQHYLMDHHLAHAWSNFNFNKNSQCIILDGIGSGGNTSMIYTGNKIIRNNYYSPGTCLSSVGGRIGITSGMHLDNAGKVMGLVPYGTPDKHMVNSLKKYVTTSLAEVILKIPLGDGVFPKEGSQKLFNNVSTINELCYELVFNMFQQVDKHKPVIYSGGCALNVDWNRRLLDLGYSLDIQPHVYDGGLSIGCLRYALNLLDVEMTIPENFPYVQDDIAPDQRPSPATINKVADLLAQGKIVAWYQANGELGPRALGNRSILMNPTIKDGKDILNAKVKKREWFRPFGASVKEDKCSEHFDLNYNPYMLFTSNVLNTDLHAVTHVDGTCRHQTVNSSQNEDFYSLLDSFETKTGLPVLLNTSLNLGGKPIASNPEAAIELLNTTELDVVCIGDEVIVK